MKFSTPIPLLEIAQLINAEIIGDAHLIASGINEIHKVESGDITFVDVEKYFKKSLESAATIIILNQRIDCPEGKALLLCDNPFQAYNKLVQHHRPFRAISATISESSNIHPSTIIEPNVIIASDVTIGKNCYIQANVTIQAHTIIGDNVVIQSGSVIGSDAFYFKRDPRLAYQQWHSGGRVIIENDVLIGAGCTIAKGVSGDTIIGEGSKLDCQVHIGHGVVVGKRCLFAAQVGIGGKTIIEDEVVLYGQVGVAQNIRIGKKSIVLAKSGVSKDLEGNKVYFGYPASEAREKYKELATLRRLTHYVKK